jgi:hypothetical protein
MNRIQKLELIQRSLGLRHKLRVHESVKAPDTHEELAITLLSKWELEDELCAIEEILADNRLECVEFKKSKIVRDGTVIGREGREARAARELAKVSARPAPSQIEPLT